MNEEIAEILAKNYPFTSRQILDLYNSCKSWDAVITACENSGVMGIETLILELNKYSWAQEAHRRINAHRRVG